MSRSLKLLKRETKVAPVDRLSVKRAAGQVAPYDYDERTTELLAMLRTKRPAGSQTEQDFVDQWVKPLGTEADEYGNHWLTIGDSHILWSCHTDTVHTSEGAQYVGFTDGCAYVARSNCLGADDTTGVWLMRQMILAKVPGTYIFHREEEIGGLGSSWIAENTPERLAGLEFAIAFDRKGYSDIIVNQWSDTASETFAYSLADALLPLHYEPADGIFTDTQNYADLIPECTNLSVGYHGMHSASEWQDVDYAMRLLDRLVSADFSGLLVAREPMADDDGPFLDWPREGLAPTMTRDADRWADTLWDKPARYHGEYEYPTKPDRGIATLDRFCAEYPETVADFLTTTGYGLSDLKRYSGID